MFIAETLSILYTVSVIFGGGEGWTLFIQEFESNTVGFSDGYQPVAT